VTVDAAVQVTSGSQIVESMKVSRDGKWLLYDSDRNGNADIFRIALSGGVAATPERLTSEPFDEFAPSLSADGQYVAYHSWRTGSRDIEIKPLAGGAVEFVTATPSQESFPEWSPDGRAIAFTDLAADSARGAYAVRRAADGKWSKPIMRLPGGGRPHWSPDGRLLAVSMLDGSVSLVSPDSGPARVIYKSAPEDPKAAETTWIDPGTIAFKSRDAQGRAELWSIPVAGGRPRLLVRFTDPQRPSNRADFHTDGKRFYFSIEDRQSDIWVAEIIKK